MADAADAGPAQLRRDPVRGHWVVIAPDRARRPIVCGDQNPVTTGSEHDPFLAGNESETPAQLFSLPDDSGNWSVRVVPNRYPALTPEATSTRKDSDLFQSAPALGCQEVIVECPQFETELVALGVGQMAKVLSAWQARLRAVRTEGRFDHAVVFKNSGTAAGASLPHAHSQLVAMAHRPVEIDNELRRARAFFDEKSVALIDAVLKRERDAGRLVVESQHVAAFCPFASRFSSEVWIVPRGDSVFCDPDSEQIEDIAAMLHGVLGGLLQEFPWAPYNLLLHATPFSVEREPWFRWRLEICPRLAELAGFEIATGCYINALPPEVAAAALRDRLSE